MELFVILGVVAVLVLLIGLIAFGQRWRRRRRSILWENALKQICSAKQEGRSTTPSEIAGRLRLSPQAMLRLAQALESAGLVRSEAGVLTPTETGECLGMHVLRGHRLWERYLSDEGRVPLDRLHDAAEAAEHRLSAEALEALEDHLGHPRVDPHGDIIPTAAGTMKPQERTPLTDWPLDRPAVVVHVEDEPGEVLTEAVRGGLQPGAILRVVARDATAVTCETPAGRRRLAPAVAAGIDVRAAAAGEEVEVPGATLAALPLGRQATIVGLSKVCTGLSRRRLLDLGFTTGAEVRAVLSNLGDEDRAYQIRGTVIALRKEQAEHVLIGPVEGRGQSQPEEPKRR